MGKLKGCPNCKSIILEAVKKTIKARERHGGGGEFYMYGKVRPLSWIVEQVEGETEAGRDIIIDLMMLLIDQLIRDKKEMQTKDAKL